MNGEFTEIGYIYTLTCPDTGVIRYIGSTYRPQERIWSHNGISASNKRLGQWKYDLLIQGKKPIMSFIKVCPKKELLEFEGDYHQMYKHLDLLNYKILGRHISEEEAKETIEIAKIKKLKQIDVAIGTGLHPVLISEFFRRCINHMSGEKERKIRDFVLSFNIDQKQTA